MTCKESNMMDERLKFVARLLEGDSYPRSYAKAITVSAC